MAAPLYRDLIERGALAHGPRTALIVDKQSFTFQEVNHRANQYAHALIGCGLAKASRLGVLLNNSVDSLPLDFAVAKAGLNKVPLNARLSLDEHVRMLREAECGWFVFGADLAGRAAEIIAALPQIKAFGLGCSGPNAVDLWPLANQASGEAPDVPVGRDDIILTLYTSGTTGVLKAAQHSQQSWAAICRNILLNLFPVSADDRLLHAASLIHASGTFVLPLWLRGACNVVLPTFQPEAYLQALQTYQITAINLVPTMLQMLLDHPSFTPAAFASVKHICYGASPMPRPLIERAIAHFGQQRFWQYYGQTEVPLCLAVLRPEDHVGAQLAAAGRIGLDISLRLIDADGADVAPGEAGEVLVRADSMASGYFNAEALTNETFGADGWVRTRDIGQLDDRGFLYLLDRTSDMIISGGYNIYPREVEEALLSHQAVAEAAVVGAADPKWVEKVVAFVSLRPDAEATEADLIAHVAGQIASYKKPHQVRFVADVPKTAIGKIDRKILRRQLAAEEGA